MVEQKSTVRISNSTFVALPKGLAQQAHMQDGQEVRVVSTPNGLFLALNGGSNSFEQILQAYQSTGDEGLAEILLDMVEGCLGEAAPGEYDPDLKWGGYYEGR